MDGIYTVMGLLWARSVAGKFYAVAILRKVAPEVGGGERERKRKNREINLVHLVSIEHRSSRRAKRYDFFCKCGDGAGDDNDWCGCIEQRRTTKYNNRLARRG